MKKSNLNLSDNLNVQLHELIQKDFSEKTELCRIMSESGSDKCSDWHNYTPIYSALFSESKNKELNFFELGLFKGSSIQGWKKYFPNSKIYGADVEPNYLVNDERIKSFICDQDDIDSIKNLWTNFLHDNFFDIILDDGKHEFASNLIFLKNSIHMLKTGGIFIVEDLTDSTSSSFQSSLNGLKTELLLSEIFILDIPNKYNKIDNRLLVIRK